jgi:hypothetical protein
MVLTLLTGTPMSSALAQGEESNENKHRVTIVMANSHIPAANKVASQHPVFIVPTWGVNYDYWFTPKWAIGLQNDIVLQHYKIEKKKDQEVIERVDPVTICGVALFRPIPKLTFLAGLGSEIERNENFTVLLVGTEYGIELPSHWEVNFNLTYESKIATYNSWMFGVGFSKHF